MQSTTKPEAPQAPVVKLVPQPIRLVGRRLVCAWPEPIPLFEAQRQLWEFGRLQVAKALRRN
jgi:hypothetical protein